MERWVLDTDVIVAAVRSPTGASAELVRAAGLGFIKLLARTALMLEYEAVCMRSEHLAAAELDASEMQIILDGIIAISEPIEMHFLWRPQLRDPDDEMVLETAINGRATAIVSFNVRDFSPAAKNFALPLLKPVQALERIRP